ncbi:MAG: phosphatase PAP2 family protein [Thermoleophilaceae bacterium]
MLARAKLPLALAAGCAGAFLGLLALAYFAGFAAWSDGAALQGFLGLQRPLTVPVFDRLVHLADPLPYALFGLGLVAAALAQGRPRHAAAAVLLVGGSAVSSQVLKPLLATERTFHFADVQAAAYPSGHATAAMALALAAVLVAPPAWRRLTAVAGGALALAISFSILALGWHFPSDVVGGYLVATTWCLLAVAALRAAGARWADHSGRDAARHALNPRRARALAGSVGIAAAVVLGALAPHAASYAQRHTAFAAVAAAITLAAAMLLATVTAATRR